MHPSRLIFPIMSGTTTTVKQTELKNHTVHLRYFKQVVGKNAQVVEREVEEDVEVAMLARTSRAHSDFGPMLLERGATGALSDISPVARRFCEMLVVDEKQRADILNDTMACLDLYGSKEAQQDIERFLSRWGVVEQVINHQEPDQNRSGNL